MKNLNLCLYLKNPKVKIQILLLMKDFSGKNLISVGHKTYLSEILSNEKPKCPRTDNLLCHAGPVFCWSFLKFVCQELSGLTILAKWWERKWRVRNWRTPVSCRQNDCCMSSLMVNNKKKICHFCKNNSSVAGLSEHKLTCYFVFYITVLYFIFLQSFEFDGQLVHNLFIKLLKYCRSYC